MFAAYSLRLPTIPENLIQESIAYLNTINLQEAYDPKEVFSKQDWQAVERFYMETNYTKSKYARIMLTDELKNKIVQGLCNDNPHLFDFISNLRMQVIHDGEAICPHRDNNRQAHLIYPVTKDFSLTEFYSYLNKDPERYVYSLKELSGPIEVHKFRPNTWYLFNNQKVHMVKNNNQVRMALCVDLDASYHNMITKFTAYNIINWNYYPLFKFKINLNVTNGIGKDASIIP